VSHLHAHDAEVVVTIEYDKERECAAYDYAVVAAGFDTIWFEPLLTEGARAAVRAATGLAPERPLTPASLEAIDVDLSVDTLRPHLHLPMLAGMAQGPGFPNLSCLGLLADRILRPYTSDPRTGVRAHGAAERSYA
jgi:mycobactin lysine-N-oxygenase